MNPPLSTRSRSLSIASDVFAGGMVGCITLALAGSYALLIFSGPLAPYASWGATLALITAVVIGLFTLLAGTHAGQVCIPQDRIAPILGFMSASIIALAGADAAPEALFATLAAAIACSTLLTGLAVYLLGRFQMGNLIRFVPYPVIGGFLAGSGWLLATGSVRAATGLSPAPEHWHELLVEGRIGGWIPVAAFGFSLFALQRRLRHWAVLPGFLALAVGGFYAGLALAGLAPEDARASGWLIPALAQGASLPDWHALPALVDGWMVLQMGAAFAAVAMTSIVSILLNSSAMDLEAHRETDLNRELRTLGVGNLLAGLGGGMVGFPSLSLSRLVKEAGATGRLVHGAMVVVCLACLAGNLEWIGTLPRFVLGGLLLYLGLVFLHEWLIASWDRLPRADYAAVVVILGVIAFSGYFQGVAVGLLIATLVFVANYSRVRVVTHRLSGAEQRSNVDRSPEEQDILAREGRRIQVLRLQGFIFFGSASSLLTGIREQLESGKGVDMVVVDFSRVYGLDSSAVISLRKLRELVAARRATLVLCGVAPRILRQMERSGLDTEPGPHLRVLPDRDRALEWCEERILEGHPEIRQRAASGDLLDRLAASWPADGPPIRGLETYLERRNAREGEWILRQGDPAHELFFLERGRLTAMIEGGRRLRSMAPGAVVGELGLYLNEPRSASIQADEASVLRRLDRAALEKMQREAPALASAFHQCMLRLVAARLATTSRTLQTVLE